MRLENILALTNGELKSNPFVSDFNDFVFNPKKVKKGDLFVANTPEFIDEAIQNGAYAVLYDFQTQVSDDEIAWIKVENIETALLRLLRFFLIDKDIKAYFTDSITLKLAQQIKTKDIYSLDKTIYESFADIFEKPFRYIFFDNKRYKDLFVEIYQFPKISRYSIDIVEKTLYETSFIFKDVYYERKNISPFFIPFLEKLLNFFVEKEISFEIKDFGYIDNFEVVFVNNNLEIKENGQGNKVLIFEKDTDLAVTEALFLQKEIFWAKTVFLFPKTIKQLKDIYVYENVKELKQLLRKTDFHFALVGGKSKDILEQIASKTPQQLTLNLI